MIHFGTAGNCQSFYAQGLEHSHQAPAWLAGLGLTAYEYAAGRGVRLGQENAAKIAEAAALHNIAVSIHAPYYINLAQEDPEKVQNSFRHFVESAEAVRRMGGERIIYHAGSVKKKHDRQAAMDRACNNLEEALRLVEDYDVRLCPETMGRAALLGTVEDVITFCRLDDRSLPAIDFAHLHAVSQGGIRGKDDYRRVLDTLLDALGEARMKHFHVHFCHIAYRETGEDQHKNFDDEGYGPDFEPLAELLLEYKLEPTIICESRGHQAEDALTMQRLTRAYCESPCGHLTG